MLFNSPEYAAFLVIVFAAYWMVGSRNVRWQNALLLVASYLFYGLWDWRFLFLIIGITALGFVCALKVEQTRRKGWLWICVGGSLATLGLFKYYDFFVCQFGLLTGMDTESLMLNLLLPVGISFYTFQSIGYCCDVYMRKSSATCDVLGYFTFVAFFPQLVAGPIERFSNLFPQIAGRRSFDASKAFEGLRLILWGLFKKIVIADRAATVVDLTFSDMSAFNTTSLWIAAMLFYVQIYCDFSCYTDIAIGSARLFGINLMQNFRNPYLAHGVQDFWRRWHISLTGWFRDYVYIPLGGNRTGRRRRNTWVVFLLSGLWHGANWTFLAWGAFHALLHDVERLLKEWLGIKPMNSLLTFLVATVGWVIFRAESMTQACAYISCMFDFSGFGGLEFSSLVIAELLFAIAVLFGFEILNKEQVCALAMRSRWRIAVYLVLSLWVIMSFTTTHSFIYFQF